MSLNAWVLATRPKTLTAALSPILVASALAISFGAHYRWWISLCALGASLFIQFGTNLVNDAIDFKKGTDNEHRLGPQRMSQSGRLDADLVLKVAYVFFASAFLLGLPLVREGGLPILIIGLLSIAFAYFYTGGPYPLAYNGLGEIFVLIFFGWVAIGGLYFLQSGAWFFGAGVAGTQVGLLAAVLIQINNLRDIDGDRLNSKRSLAVKFGKKFARGLLVSSLAAPYVVGFYWLSQGRSLAAFLPLLTLPLAVRLARDLRRTEPGVIYNSFLARAALTQLLFSVLLAAGLVLESAR